jgi:hypothetical protein
MLLGEGVRGTHLSQPQRIYCRCCPIDFQASLTSLLDVEEKVGLHAARQHALATCRDQRDPAAAATLRSRLWHRSRRCFERSPPTPRSEKKLLFQ